MNRSPLNLFFSGIGGSGVSAIASFMAGKGHRISGSDRAFDSNPLHPVFRALIRNGMAIVPQDGSGIHKALDLLVVSTAVESDQPEIIRARELGIPIKTRPHYLAEIVSSFRTIAVAGTSGKSTASGILAFLMQRLGLRPNFIGGGRVKNLASDTNPGNAVAGDSEHLVIEACESDGTIVDYRPVHSIILNLDLDHHSIDKTREMFRALIRNTSGMIILNADDGRLGTIAPRHALTFSIDSSSLYRPEQVLYHDFGTDFFLRDIPFHLSIPGKYNLSNALAGISLLAETGIPLPDIARFLPEFSGIDRRFDIHLNDGKRLVVDDYAHNPHKIASLMGTMKQIRERICYIFQPHGFAPTRMMKKEYVDAFAGHLRDADHLILLPIFYAGGTVSKDISSHDLAEGIRAKGKSVEVVEKRENIIERASDWNTYVVLGARDETLSDFTHGIADALLKKN
ncbi:MAG: UDP-N-acetylmuramate--L-alanine ligase [bacterium]